MTPFIAEIIGTMILLLLGNGVVANVVLKDTKGFDSGLIVISIGWGLAVYCGVVVAGPISGAHLNPAVTIGLAVAGSFAWSQVGSYILAQCIGAFIGSVLVWLTYKDHYDRTEDPGSILGSHCTAPAISNPVLNVIAEAVGTFVLVFCVLYIADPTISLAGDAKAAIGLGSVGALPVALVVIAIGVSLGGPTGYAINPARDLMPRIAHTILPIKNKGGSDWGYSWIPIVGPILGAVIAALLAGTMS